MTETERNNTIDQLAEQTIVALDRLDTPAERLREARRRSN
jgi:hypothetical protein